MTKEPFFRYPLPNISRTIFEFDSICLAEREHPHRFTVHYYDLCEIEGQSAFFLSNHFSKSVHAFSVDPPTHAQHHKVFPIDNSFDLAAHRGRSLSMGTQTRHFGSLLNGHLTVVTTELHTTAHSEVIDHKGGAAEGIVNSPRCVVVFVVFGVLRC